MIGKHFEITLDNKHWPMTYTTTEVTDAYECIANLLDSMHAAHVSYKTGFLMALAAMTDSHLTEKTEHSALGITVRLKNGEV